MKFSRLLAIAAASMTVTIAAWAQSPAPPPAPSVGACVAGSFEAIGCFLDGAVARKQIPGASVLVRQGGKDVYFGARGLRDVEAGGPVARDTIFRIYSMTKPVTAAAVMLLVEDGRIRLDDPITKYVPEFATTGVYAGEEGGVIKTVPVVRPITVEDLLTHTSGLTYGFQRGTPVAALYARSPLAGDRWRFDPAFGGADGLARTLAGFPLAYQPGSRWHYGMSLDIAAIIVERASGTPFAEFLQQRLFGPLDMVDTGFNVPPSKASRFASLYMSTAEGGLRLVDAGATSPLVRPVPVYSGGGGLVSTIDDYARFAQMLADGGRYKGRRILSRRTVHEMMRNHLSPAVLTELIETARFGLGGTGAGMGFGYGGAVLQAPRGAGSVGEYLWGGAASTTFWVDPKRDIVVVFMTQVLPPVQLRDELHRLVYEAAPAKGARRKTGGAP